MERGRVLSSRQSENNFSKGRFQLRFIEGRSKLVFNSINLPTTEPNEAYYEKKSTVSDSNTSSLDYFHGNEIWTSVWSVPDNICKDFLVRAGTGVCGYNTICNLKVDKRPKCECLRGYSFLDPNDPYGSCKPDFTQECTEDEHSYEKELYAIEEIPNIDWPGIDYIHLRPFTEENCNNSCLQDCMCTIAVFANDDGCWKKKLPLSNGRFDSNFNGKAFIKVMKDNSTLRGPCKLISGKEPIQNKRKEKILILVGSVLLGCSVFVKFSLIVSKKIKTSNEKGSVLEMNLHCFTYKYLQDAIDGFKEQLGKGSFGVVYKGSINMGSNVLLAVKKLNSVAQESEEELQIEVNIIARTYHKNLQWLFSMFLFGDLKPNWKERIQIVVGISRGLLYLHEECSCQIIHYDIKPQNILLDEHYNARISDFGLAKLLRIDQSHTHTAIRGTKGYVAPEWFKNMPINSKVYVYSYGVVLVEIICCRKSVLAMESGGEHNAILIDWAYDCFRDGEINALVEFDVEAMDDMGNVERFVKVAIWCIQED
ncbi:hypothetical protein I3760_13G166500 [Carya illinoinensis]|nr:hypothetical protein I3760_13G166500 [Carya illinoinensis]